MDYNDLVNLKIVADYLGIQTKVKSNKPLIIDE